MLVTSSGEALGTIGGGGMERRLIDEALDALRLGEPRSLHFAMGVPAREGMIPVNSKCGGEVKIFMDVLKPEPRLIIMGSGLIAQAVARYSIDCGFHVTVVDDADTATADNFPGVELVNDAYPESLTKVNIRPSDYVAMLHGETDFGLLGSGNKAKEHKRHLKEEGYDPETVDAIKGPIGLEIDAETPEEIAVSIVAELIEVRRG